MKILFGVIGAMIAGGIVSVLGVESAAFRGIAAAVGLGCGWLAHGMLEDRQDRARIARELEQDRIRYERERVTKGKAASVPKVQPQGSSDADFHDVVRNAPVAAAASSRLRPMDQGFTQEDLQDLICLGAFHYESLLREKNLVNDEKGEINGVVPYATWEVFMLAGLCDLNLGQLNERLKGLESPSWESLLSTKIINPRIIKDQASLNVRRRYLPNAYIRSKATIVGALAFSNGAQEFDAWRTSVVVGLNYDEANKVEPYLREVFESVQKLVRDARSGSHLQRIGKWNWCLG